MKPKRAHDLLKTIGEMIVIMILFLLIVIYFMKGGAM